MLREEGRCHGRVLRRRKDPCPVIEDYTRLAFVVGCCFSNSETDELADPGHGSAECACDGLMAAVVPRDEDAFFAEDGPCAAFRLTYPGHVVALLGHGAHNTSADGAELNAAEEFDNSRLTCGKPENLFSGFRVQVQQNVFRQRSVLPEPVDLVAVLSLMASLRSRLLPLFSSSGRIRSKPALQRLFLSSAQTSRQM